MSDGVLVDANGSYWYSRGGQPAKVREVQVGDVVRHNWPVCPDTFRVSELDREHREVVLHRVEDGLEWRTPFDGFHGLFITIEEAGS